MNPANDGDDDDDDDYDGHEEAWHDDDDDDDDADDEGAPPHPTDATAAATALHTVPLVELSLERITYAPITRSVGGAGSGAETAGGRRKHLAPWRRLWRRERPEADTNDSSTAETRSRRVILRNVSTTVSPYTLSAWMGPSGSGKTSLITVAAGLLSDPSADLIDDSTIRVNGTRGAAPKRLIGVVWQDDLLLPNLTVEETIAFAARLKTPESVGKEAVSKIVNDTIVELGLAAVRDSLIGGGGSVRGISGGERKRVAVAVELVARPSVLLLDEPTSGLDATSAQSLIQTLKDLAGAGHAVAIVVHQPRTAIFELFDALLLLSRGRVVYGGEPGGARRFLESVPGVGVLPDQTGIADWIMDVVTADEGREGGGMLANCWAEARERTEAEEGRRRSDNVPHAKGQPGGDVVECAVRHGATASGSNSSARRRVVSRPPRRRLSSLAELNSEPKFKTTRWTQLVLLTRRSMKQQRGERLTRVACLFTATYVVLSGILWWRLPDDTNRIYERNSLLFFMIIAQSNTIVVSSLTLFSRERSLLARERAKKMYGVLPYFVAKTVSDMTNTVFLPTLYGAVVYWMANLRPTAAAFFSFLLTFYLAVSTAQSTGLLLSVAIPNLQIALMLAPAINLFLMILGGFYIPLNNLHPGVAWASWLSFARYGFSGLIVNEFAGRTVPCAEGPVSISVGGESDECPLPGEAVLQSMGVEGALTNLWLNVGILIIMQTAMRVGTYVLLRRSR